LCHYQILDHRVEGAVVVRKADVSDAVAI